VYYNIVYVQTHTTCDKPKYDKNSRRSWLVVNNRHLQLLLLVMKF